MGINDYIIGHRHSEEEIENLKELRKIKEAKKTIRLFELKYPTNEHGFYDAYIFPHCEEKEGFAYEAARGVLIRYRHKQEVESNIM